jgi:hypothetical protein
MKSESRLDALRSRYRAAAHWAELEKRKRTLSERIH